MIPAPTQAASTSRPGALLLCLAGGATLLLLAHHPVTGLRIGDPAMPHALVRLGGAAAAVHGVLIGLVGALLYGVLTLALALGLRRPPVAFGLGAYGFGCAAMIGAMLMDGFMVAPLAQRLLAEPASGGDAAFLLLAIAIQVLTKAGLWGMGIGMACLSWARAGAVRMLAVLALPAALLPAAAASVLHLDPHSLIMLTGLQALWYGCAAFYLWRGITR